MLTLREDPDARVVADGLVGGMVHSLFVAREAVPKSLQPEPRVIVKRLLVKSPLSNIFASINKVLKIARVDTGGAGIKRNNGRLQRVKPLEYYQ
jgi:hypothetical protein